MGILLKVLVIIAIIILIFILLVIIGVYDLVKNTIHAPLTIASVKSGNFTGTTSLNDTKFSKVQPGATFNVVRQSAATPSSSATAPGGPNQSSIMVVGNVTAVLAGTGGTWTINGTTNSTGYKYLAGDVISLLL
jgi:hypothetical protein